MRTGQLISWPCELMGKTREPSTIFSCLRHRHSPSHLPTARHGRATVLLLPQVGGGAHSRSDDLCVGDAQNFWGGAAGDRGRMRVSLLSECSYSVRRDHSVVNVPRTAALGAVGGWTTASLCISFSLSPGSFVPPVLCMMDGISEGLFFTMLIYEASCPVASSSNWQKGPNYGGSWLGKIVREAGSPSLLPALREVGISAAD